MTRLSDLAPELRPLAEALVRELRVRGIPHSVQCTLRSLEDQQKAFADGFSKCDGIVRKSMHQLGLAIDIVPVSAAGRPTWNYRKYATEYRRIGEVARSLGLICGQDWEPIDKGTGLGWDPPHYEMRRG